MKGNFSLHTHPTCSDFTILRYGWKDGESRHSVEFIMAEDDPPEEVAYKLEQFASFLRDKSNATATYR